MVKTSRQLALLEGISAGLLFGAAAIFIRLLADVNALNIAFWRLMIASITLLPIILTLWRRSKTRLAPDNLKHVAVLGILLGSHFIFFISAVQETTIMNAAVLVNTTPIFSIFISTFLYGSKPSRKAVAGIILSFAGAGLIAYTDFIQGQTASLIGDLKATAAAAMIAFYLNYGQKKRRKLPLLQTMFSVYLVAALFIAALAVLGSVFYLSEPPFMLSFSLNTLLLLGGIGILSTATAHTLFFSSLSSLKSFETATMALLEPLGATLLGVMVFAEVPEAIFVLGALLITLGLLLVAKGE